jgi:ethanolamine ammonia-lyase large subunit
VSVVGDIELETRQRIDMGLHDHIMGKLFPPDIGFGVLPERLQACY